MKKQQKSKAQIMHQMMLQEKVNRQKPLAEALLKLLNEKGLNFHKAKIALQVIAAMIMQAATSKANNTHVKDYSLDELVQKDSDYDIYREITILFNDATVLDATDVLNGLNQELSGALERESKERLVSDIKVDIL
jgi:hypothetical protein